MFLIFKYNYDKLEFKEVNDNYLILIKKLFLIFGKY